MSKMNSLHNKILKTLYKANSKLDAFTLFKRMKVSFSEYTQAVNVLIENKIVEKDEYTLRLTKIGREKVLVRLNANGTLFKHWRNVPEDFMGPQMPINEPYIPSIKRLDKKTF